MRDFFLALMLAALWVACASPETTDTSVGAVSDTVDASVPWSDAPWEKARQRGVTFRATGNEPGWHVEVWTDSLIFTTMFGEEVYRFPEVEVVAEGDETTVYRASTDGKAITVTQSAVPCEDDMSGQPFEATVAVTFDGHTYEGCGRALDGP